MALSLVAPAIILIGVLARVQYVESQRRYEQQLTATTTALALATERQLGQGQSILETLAVSPALAAGDLASFEAQARAAVAGKSGWIVLIGPERQIINTLLPRGQQPPHSTLPPERWAAVRAGRTTVSNLAYGKVSGGPIVAIDMPVVVGGDLYDLAYIQRPSAFANLFAAQNLPHSWTGAIVDRNASLVARSKEQAKMLGRKASPDMRAAMAKDNSGVVMTHTLDGTATMSAFSRSSTYGWTFIVGVPRAELSRATWVSAGLVWLSAGLLIGLGVIAALLFARPISREVRALVVDAGRVAAGEPMDGGDHGLQEIAEVRRSLSDASLQLRHREREAQKAAERQRLMINELNHRVKNTLAIVQSLARHSLRKDGASGLESFNDRLHALAKAHDLLTRRIWESAELREVVLETLAPYGAQASAEGPAVMLRPGAALGFSMIFHELATNAAKYGALSAPTGQVRVSWSQPDPERPGHVVLRWTETGGPTAIAPATTGFGSRLIATTLRGEVKGEARFDYPLEGLICTLSVEIEPPGV